MIGQTISHYRILEKLGEGGMGIVYKAEDIQLKRTVALKFLPDRVNKDSVAKDRFLQEAQAAAALNHPNICTIYGIEEADDKTFIAMEYIDGKTLRELETFNSKLETVVGYAVQIGEALQEAHSKGIVHRDIKADNIMLTSKGQAKVMDFGLAKLKGAMKLTRTSSTVGTLGYMAPEQIQGGEVDHRSDIFSFGVLLFEMLTGKLPFRGEHEAAMMYSILNEEPESLQKYSPDAPLEVLHVLNRALEKNPEDRYQGVHDVVIDLRRSRKETERVSKTFAVSSGDLSSARRALKPSWRSNVWYIAGAVGVLAIAALVFFWPRSTGELNPDRNTNPLDLSLSEIGYAGLSADGKLLAFPAVDGNGTLDIYTMHTSGGDPTRITFDSARSYILSSCGACISPDSRLIAYSRPTPRNDRNQACVVPVLRDTPPILVADTGYCLRWRPDGKRLGYIVLAGRSSKGHEFWTVSPKGTDRELEFIDTAGLTGRFSFAWSPDGESIAWLRTYPGDYQEIIVRALVSGRERKLTSDKKKIDEVYWAANNQILYSTNKAGSTNIWTVPSTGGKPVQITTGEGPDCGITLSDDCRKLVYLRIRTIGHLWRGFTDGSEAKQLTAESRLNASPSFSPDRKQVVFASKSDELSTNFAIRIMDRDGQNSHELVPPDAYNISPTWSPDGKWIAYTAYLFAEPDSSMMYIIDPAGTRTNRLRGSGYARRWINSNILVIRRGIRYWELNVHSGEQKPIFEDSTFAVPVIGGKYTCYLDPRSNHRGVWLIENSSGSRRVQPKLLATLEELGGQSFLTVREASMLLHDDNGVMQKVLFPTGTRKRIHGTFPGLRKDSYTNVSYDEKEMVYEQILSDSKLVMIENVFK